MKKINLLAAMLMLTLSVFGQKSALSVQYGNSITNEDLYDHLSILASDALEGRETGKRGQVMAAALISNHFESLNLNPIVDLGGTKSYFQGVPLYSILPGNSYLKIKKSTHNNFDNVVYLGNSSAIEEQSSSVIFAGRGTEADFENIDVKGKAVFVMVENARAWRAPRKIAMEKGAKIVLISSTKTDEEFQTYAGRFKNYLAQGITTLDKPNNDNEYLGLFLVAPSIASDIFNKSYEKLNQTIIQKEAGDPEALKKVKNGKVTFNINQIVDDFSSANVLGYMEGSDLKDELVVISAHYDHIGKRDTLINNGADDNGSGTSAVMELAQAFSLAKKDGNGPRRSILFVAFTGEEKGLLGSEYYSKFPVIPLAQTIVDLNIDMIGRVDPKYKDAEDYVFLVGSDKLSTELHELSENINNTYSKLNLDYTYNDINHPERIYYRSDHWNFAKNNIPVIFYTDGEHEDYHKPTDTVDKINFDILRKRTQLVFHTAWELANRDKRPIVDKTTD